jgi:hypothetical protein
MLLMNDLKRTLWGMSLSIFVCHIACAEAINSWQVTTGKRAFIVFNGKQIGVDRSLQAKLRHAETAVFLPLDLGANSLESLRWLLVREPSRGRGDVGFCGAGHEDHLLLVKVVKSIGKTVDDFLVQSCLRSISMDMDQFDELLGGININAKGKQLTLKQSISNEKYSIRNEVNIAVVGQRMKVSTRQVVD